MADGQLALTGPGAAAFHKLDGFRDITWPARWCAPAGSRAVPGVLRARDFELSSPVGEVPVCAVGLVVRHLNAVPGDLIGQPDGISPRDRCELAVEHALREGHRLRPARGGNQPGDVMLREILALRRNEPATGSYAETRAVQLFRSWDLAPWRQVPIVRNGRIVFRADFMVPLRRGPRPEVPGPADGLIIEIDGREFHEHDFERDQRRGLTYTELGFNWMSCTPNQVEHDPAAVHRALVGALRRAGSSLASAVEAGARPTSCAGARTKTAPKAARLSRVQVAASAR